MRVGVDLDGVVVNFVDALRSSWGLDPTEFLDPFKWEIWECWGMTKENFVRWSDESYETHLFYKAEPYPGAVEALHELHELGHSVHIVTARHHPVGRRDTVAWLEDHGVHYDSLTFSDDKTCVPVDVFVEDNLPNAEACAKAGVKSFLMDRPWNQADTEVPRVITMFDFVQEVQHVQAQDCQRREAQGEQQSFLFGEERVTSETGGQKGQKPEQMSLLPTEALMEISRVYSFGAGKYSRSNWRRGYDYHLSYDAMQRHLARYWGGETYDPETGRHHLGHAAFHAMTLITFDSDPERYERFDDRQHKERDDA